jgi:hypothetical protein
LSTERGDVIKVSPARSYSDERARRLRLYFDSGSLYTFIKESATRGFRDILKLSMPRKFEGRGNGAFHAAKVMNLEVKLLGFWCPHYAHVVDDGVLTQAKDMLIGHDFMQKFSVTIASWQRDVILDRLALQRAQSIR